jgi:hypothetical protein
METRTSGSWSLIFLLQPMFGFMFLRAFSCAEDVGFSDGGFGGGDNDAEEAQILPVPISVGPKL